MSSNRAAPALLALALAAPLLGAEPGLRVVFIGDGGTGGPEQKAVARQLRRFEKDLRHVFLLGDNVYFSGRARHIGPAFHEVYARLLARRTPEGEPQVLFHAALGNHDARLCDVSPDLAQLSADRDAYDWKAEGCDVEHQLSDAAFGYPEGHRYYEVPLNDAAGRPLATVFVLDSNTLPATEAPGRRDPAQLQWLSARLETSKRPEAGDPWRVVTLHKPVLTPGSRGYVFGKGGHSEDALLVESLATVLLGPGGHGPDPALTSEVSPLFLRGGVDAVFGGHNHFYARLVPDDTGIRHFVSGGGGIATYEPDRDSAPLAAAGGFNHFVTAVLSPGRFEYCVIDALGRVRDHGYFEKGQGALPDQPLDRERYEAVCGR